MPATQLGADAPQVRPQAPQLAVSVATSTHAAPQAVLPAGHAHVPALQTPPVGQTTPQVPQLFTSVCELLHVPLQYRSDDVHSRQEPVLQPWPDGHTRPQAPQLFTSVSTETHAPPQGAVPTGHAPMQAPATQFWPAAQAIVA